MKFEIKENEKKNTYEILTDDGKKYFIEKEIAIKLNLYEKEELTSKEINEIVKLSDIKTAKSKALQLLSKSYRPSADIKRKLKDSGYSKSIISKAIDDMKSLGYINDILYIRKYVHDREKLNPKSESLLKYELKIKGLNKNDINEVLDELCIDDEKTALSIMQKRFKDKDLNDQKTKRKAYNYLKSRGFSMYLIKSTINTFNETINNSNEYEEE